ncbi:MAG: hydrogenase maturation nickel metallochaperone HypA [Chloroflexi bacterium]|nr:hydrogenase maturation nickel metallochaperone HypA [Chloroflexota bacterium]
MDTIPLACDTCGHCFEGHQVGDPCPHCRQPSGTVTQSQVGLGGPLQEDTGLRCSNRPGGGEVPRQEPEAQQNEQQRPDHTPSYDGPQKHFPAIDK